MSSVFKNKKLLIIIGISLAIIIGGIVAALILVDNKSKKNTADEKIVKKEVVNEGLVYYKGSSVIKMVFEEQYTLCDQEICSKVNTKIKEIGIISDDINLDISKIKDDEIDVYEALNELVSIDMADNPDLKSIFIFYNSPNINIEKLNNVEGIEISGGYLKDINEEDILKLKDNSFVITFDSNGGSKIPIQLVKENELATKPNNPTRDGYIFVEWRLDGKAYEFDNPVTKDITLIAFWKADSKPANKEESKNSNNNDKKSNNDNNKKKSSSGQNNNSSSNSGKPAYEEDHTIYFDSDGGSQVPPMVVGLEKVVRCPYPEKDGYTFVEWQLNGKPFEWDKAFEITSDITLKAKWQQINCKVSYIYNLGSGNVTRTETIKCGTKAEKIHEYGYQGYEFVEWRLNGVKYDFNKDVTEDIVLKAAYEKLTNPTFTVSSKSTDSSGNVTAIYNTPIDGSHKYIINIYRYTDEDHIVETGLSGNVYMQYTATSSTRSITYNQGYYYKAVAYKCGGPNSYCSEGALLDTVDAR